MGSGAFFSPPLRVKISGGFILLLAVLLFFDDEGFIAAAVPAVAIHELCHMVAMRAFGARPVLLSATAAGFSIDYAGHISSAALAVTALAGPIGGAVFALLCARAGGYWGSEYLALCAGLGFVFCCFNLLPALPLDGGVAAEVILGSTIGQRAAERAMVILGILITTGVLVLGAWIIHEGFGAALLLSGVWLGIAQRKQTCK